MMKSWIALASVAVLLTACADHPHAANTSLSGGAIAPVASCAGAGACGNNAPPHQQYYDEHAKRYYYYDSDKAQYYWEDGAPRD
jgi:hypothetical protein